MLRARSRSRPATSRSPRRRPTAHVREQHLRRSRPERARADQPDERHHHRRRPGQLRHARARCRCTSSTRPITATLKVCKYLTTGSDALAGQAFTFDVADAGDGTTRRRRSSRSRARTAPARSSATATGRYRAAGEPASRCCSRSAARSRSTEELAGYPYVSGDGNPPAPATRRRSRSWAASTRCRSTTRPSASSRSARRC